MDAWGHLSDGMLFALSPGVLSYIFFGAFVGIVMGVLPGLGASSGMALLLPLTIGLHPTAALGMLAAIYYGVMYGNTVTSIVLSAPADGEVAATFDGYPLAKKGRAGPALVIQAIASFCGGTIGMLLLTLLAAVAARATQSIGPAEVFLIVLIGLGTIVLMLGDRWLYGVICCLGGFAVGTIGVDVTTGQQRFTFGLVDLLSGINFIAVVIGLFALSEVFHAIYEQKREDKEGENASTKLLEFWPNRQDLRDVRGATLRGSIVGFLIGMLPGAGTTVASLLAYSFEKGTSRKPERFGTGIVEGLAAPEAAHTSAVAGSMLPMLTLGIPGSAATAVLLGAFVIFGLTPGPLLMTNHPDTAWGLIASMYLGNVMLVILAIAGIPLFTRIARVPFKTLVPVILVFCSVGTYAVASSPLDLVIMLLAGVLGFYLKLYGFPPAAIVIALVLGPLAERTLRQTLIISGGSPEIFITRTPSLVILCIGVALGGLMIFFRLRERHAAKRRESLAEAGE